MKVSPNHKEVVQKRVAPFEYDEKPTQYLMETQVCFYMFHCAFVLVVDKVL
jgi:hypothetical protein